MAVTTTPMTADDLARLPDDGHRYALIRGELIRMPLPGFRHSRVVLRFSRHLAAFVEEHQLGAVGTEGGFLLARDPDQVVAPDVAFVRADRLPSDQDQDGYLPLAPDLAVEVVSPSDRAADVAAKVLAYLDAGVPMVLVLDPAQRTATVRVPGRPTRVLHEDDVFDGGDVLPGYRLPVADIFG